MGDNNSQCRVFQFDANYGSQPSKETDFGLKDEFEEDGTILLKLFRRNLKKEDIP